MYCGVRTQVRRGIFIQLTKTRSIYVKQSEFLKFPTILLLLKKIDKITKLKNVNKDHRNFETSSIPNDIQKSDSNLNMIVRIATLLTGSLLRSYLKNEI